MEDCHQGRSKIETRSKWANSRHRIEGLILYLLYHSLSSLADRHEFRSCELPINFLARNNMYCIVVLKSTSTDRCPSLTTCADAFKCFAAPVARRWHSDAGNRGEFATRCWVPSTAESLQFTHRCTLYNSEISECWSVGGPATLNLSSELAVAMQRSTASF